MILCLLQKNKAFFGFTPANAGRQLLTLGLPCLSRFTPAHAGKTKQLPLNQGFNF